MLLFTQMSDIFRKYRNWYKLNIVLKNMLIKTVWDILFCDVTALCLPVGGASERVASRSTVGSLRLTTLLHGRPVNCAKREAELCAQFFKIFSWLFCYLSTVHRAFLVSCCQLISIICWLHHGGPVNCAKRERQSSGLRVFFFVFVLKYTVIPSQL